MKIIHSEILQKARIHIGNKENVLETIQEIKSY